MFKRFAVVLLASYAMTAGLFIAGYVASSLLVDYRYAVAFWMSGWPTVALLSASFLVCWKFLKVR